MLPFGECEHILVGGIADGFVDPMPATQEDACPSAPLLTYTGATPTREFDGPNVNDQHWIHSFENLPDFMLSATLEIGIRTPLGGSNDGFVVGLDVPGGVPGWGHPISLLTGMTWTAGDTAVLTFDLEDLLGGVDLMRKMDADNRLDLRIQDDTQVDYVRLRLKTCAASRYEIDYDHTPMVAGTTVTMTATNASPGDICFFWVSTSGSGPVLRSCRGARCA